MAKMATGNYMIDGDLGTHSSSPYSEPYGSRGSEFNEQLRQMQELEEAFGVAPERLEGEQHDWVLYLDKLDLTIMADLIEWEAVAEPKLVEAGQGVVKMAIAVYLTKV